MTIDMGKRLDRNKTELMSQIACVQTSPLSQKKSGEEKSVNRRR